MVALTLVPPRPKPSRLSAVTLTRTFHSPGSRLWRLAPITMVAEWCGTESLLLQRFHPHLDHTGQDCSGRFRLGRDQVVALVAAWSDSPGWQLWLPQRGAAKTQVVRLPDGGLQLTRYDRGFSRVSRVVPVVQTWERAATFRIFAAHVVPFLHFAREGLARI